MGTLKIFLTFVAFCSVATAFADKLGLLFLLLKNLRFKFKFGGVTLFRFNLNDFKLDFLVSRGILSGVCVP